MLLFDHAGLVIPPARAVKTFGGDIDERGIASGIEIPTVGGNLSDISVSDRTSDPMLAKTVTRTSNGPITVRSATEISLSGEMVAFCVRALVFGGGSSATSGSTRRDFSYGLKSDDGNHGAYIEYRNPDRAETGCFITTIRNGVVTRNSINYTINNPGERYTILFWLTLNQLTGRWHVYCGEGDQIRHAFEVPVYELSTSALRPFIEWDWTYPTGSFAVNVASFTYDIYWRF